MANKRKVGLVVAPAAAAGVILLTTKTKAEPSPEPIEHIVTVGLLNPPPGATMWSLLLTDWDVAVVIDEVSGKDRLDMAEPANFEIQSGVKFPLRIIALQISRWNAAGTALIVLYETQSFRPYLWDWEKGEYGDAPDPTYREAFIPDYGGYYYNVATERFE